MPCEQSHVLAVIVFLELFPLQKQVLYFERRSSEALIRPRLVGFPKFCFKKISVLSCLLLICLSLLTTPLVPSPKAVVSIHIPISASYLHELQFIFY